VKAYLIIECPHCGKEAGRLSLGEAPAIVQLSVLSPEEEAKARSVKELDFSVRTHNAIKNLVPIVRTVGDLMGWTEAALLRGPNFGRKSLNEVREVLANIGLTLSSGRSEPPEEQAAAGGSA